MVDNNKTAIIIDASDTFDDGREGKVRFDSDDIKKSIKIKLGDHLSTITKEANNNPQISDGSKEISIKTSTGNPAPIDNTNDKNSGATSTFRDEFTLPRAQEAISAFDNSSNSGFLPGLEVKKGKTDVEIGKTGEELFKDLNIHGRYSSTAIATAVRLRKTNRFDPYAEYVDPDTSEDENDSNVGSILLQKNLGIHTPHNFPNVKGDTEEVIYKIKDLKNLGIQTLFEASGEYYVPDDPSNFTSALGAKAASTAPGLARLGIRIPTSRFSAAEIAGNVNDKFSKDSKFPSLKEQSMWSYGNVNNPLVPFDAISSTSSAAAAVLLTLTISEIIKLLAKAMGPPAIEIPDPLSLVGSAFSSDNKSQPDPLEKRRQRLGSYLGKDQNKEQSQSPSPIFSINSNTKRLFQMCPKRSRSVFWCAPISRWRIIGRRCWCFGSSCWIGLHLFFSPRKYWLF